jgi:hypothetical protein
MSKCEVCKNGSMQDLVDFCGEILCRTCHLARLQEILDILEADGLVLKTERNGRDVYIAVPRSEGVEMPWYLDVIEPCAGDG